MTTTTRINPNVATSASPSPSSSAPRVDSPPGRHAAMAGVAAGSMAGGSLAAGALVAAPFVPATESALTGAVLSGFAIGWAALAGLSARFTAQPQRWAAVPAVVLGVSGIALLVLG